MEPKQILKQVFGYDSFRLHQEAAITSFLNGKDVFVLMPTGGGKSLCFQIPALISEGLTVVVSPLIALMKDQVDALRLNGVEAAFINSSMHHYEQAEVEQNVLDGKLKMLYVAPERFTLADNSFYTFLKKANVTGFAIDEAHCISHWGHDFRPDYLELSALKKDFPGIPVMALTASADKATRTDIIEKLGLLNPAVYISSFNRENISYAVKRSQTAFEDLIAFLEDNKGKSGIIYTLKRNDTESLAHELTEAGFNAIPYHAGLDSHTRAKHQELFLKDEVPIVVATIAFGMGIDKPNVRFVVHMTLPKNIESYYQETGRAGRDGLPSEAILYYNRSDISTLSYFAKIEGNAQQSEIMLNKLYQMADFCETVTCRRQFLMNYFGESHPDECGNCDICLSTISVEDYTIEAQKIFSAMVRLNQQFGAHIIADFLRGSKSRKIKPWMRNLKTYGAGTEHPKTQWMQYIDVLLHNGYIKRTRAEMPVLELTQKAWSVLKKQKKVLLKVKKEQQKQLPYRERNLAYDETLFEGLRAQRTLLAQKEEVPAYIILSDKTLTELAAKKPTEVHQLDNISGFGKVKKGRYGGAFLEVIRQYENKGRLPEELKYQLKKYKKKSKDRYGKETSSQTTLNMYREGHSIKKISELRAIKESTVMAHLSEFVETGEINPSELVEPAKLKIIYHHLKQEPEQLNRELKDRLGDNFTYSDIRIARAAFSASGFQR